MARVILKGVRLAFAQNLFTPKAAEEGGIPAYSCSFILDKDSDNEKAIRDAMAKVATEKWGAKGKATMDALVKADKVCLHDGDTKADYEGFEGQIYVSARDKVAPKVLDRDKSPLSANSGRPYSGCYVNGVIEVYAQDNKYGKRLNASLKGVQFVRDGESFGGSAPARDDEFEDISNNGEGEDLI